LKQNFDAIVVGTGVSGGWAAKELCEKGLKTLVLERGRRVRHLEDYPAMHLDPWDMKNGGSTSKEDWKIQAAEMLENAGCKQVEIFDSNAPIGKGIHEMGTARMGHDPITSVLKKYNQVHSVPNVFVTDGAFMTSSGTQNPSLTYVAFTARAVHHAVAELNKGNL
jgi:choline dehydrogenase-like flavoprotein